MQTPMCLSVSVNDISEICFLFDRDFVNVTATQTTDDIEWNYYYVVPGLSFVSYMIFKRLRVE